MVKVIESKSQFEDCLKSSKLVVVDFTATWCPPCKMIAPVFEKLAASYPNVDFLKVDINANDDLASKYAVQCVPTFLFFKDGKPVDKMQGADAAKLEQLIKQHQ